MRKQSIMLIGVLALLLAPFTVWAAPQTGSWQVYTMAHGLRDTQVWRIAPDGNGGFWAGHIAGGRAVNRPGGLSHVRSDGSARVYDGTDEPFTSCPTVDELVLAPDKTLWMRLSGIHDYGSTDYLGRCTANYNNTAIGFIGADGTPQMIPPEQLPPNITNGFAVDAAGRPWIGTQVGVAVRNSTGTWDILALWPNTNAATTVIRFLNGTMLVGATDGTIARVTPDYTGGNAVTIIPSGSGTNAGIFDLTETYAMTQAGLFQYDQTGNPWRKLDLPDDLNAYRYRMVDINGTLWLTTPGGLLRRDSNGTWTRIISGETPLPNEGINDLAPDPGGANLLWMGTNDGAARLDTAGPSPDQSEARRAFDALWQRTDGGSGGSWVWGPRPWMERYEPYVEAPGGSRLVRYYDKTRMELTRPGENTAAPWYVTNGLLVMEMVRGVPQLGDTANRYEDVCPPVSSSPCRSPFIPVVGDPQQNDLAPRYGDFEPLMARQESRIGQRVTTTYTHNEQFDPFVEGNEASLGTPATTIAFYDETTGQNIPQALWDYMQRQPVDWLYLFGHPITAPVWGRAKVGGVEQWVLVQLFERRVLTYTPANAPQWQVEMGNVGQHYYRWRYMVYTPNTAPWEQ